MNIVALDIPADMAENVKKYRALLMEKVAEASEEMMNKYLDGQPLTVEEVRTAIRTMVLRDEIYPGHGLSAREYRGPESASTRSCIIFQIRSIRPQSRLDPNDETKSRTKLRQNDDDNFVARGV